MALCRILNLLLRHKGNLPIGVVYSYCMEGHISITRTFSVFLGNNSEVGLCSQLRVCVCVCVCVNTRAAVTASMLSTVCYLVIASV